MPNPHMLIGRPSNAGKPELKEAWALEVERIAGEEGSPFPIPLPGQAQGDVFGFASAYHMHAIVRSNQDALG